MIFRIPGQPIPLSRPRFCKKSGKVYDCQKDEKFFYRVLLTKQLGKDRRLEGPISLKATFAFSTPDSSLWGKPYIKVPDLSNLVKLVEDSATGILYKDDALVTHIDIIKVWQAESYTEFIVSEIT